MDSSFVTIHSSDQPIPSILEEVRKKSGTRFAFDHGELEKISMSLHVDEVPITVFLSRLLDGIPYDYRLVGKTWVIFYSKPSPLVGGEPQQVLFNWSGRIVDRQTHESLPYANVILPFENIGESTNSDGYFRFQLFPSDTVTIEVSYVGYATQRFKLDPEFIRSGEPIELNQDFSILPVVAIYGEQTEIIEEGRFVGMYTLNAEELDALPSLGESDPIRSIQLLPGVNSTSEQSAELNIRGGSSDENLIIYDGFTIYHLDHFYGIFGALNQESIKNIRLYRGWFPAKYGGRASSVIEITGKEGNLLRKKAKVDLNFTSVSASVETPIVPEKLSLIVSARRSFTDVIFSPLYQQLFNNLYNSSITQPGQGQVNTFEDNAPSFHFYDITAKVSAHPTEKDIVQLSLYRAQDKLQIGYDAVFSELNQEVEYRDDSQWGNNGMGLRWGHAGSSGWYTSINLGWSKYQSQLFARDAIYEIPFDFRDTIYSEQSTILQEYNAKLSFEKKFEEHLIEVGSWLTFNEVDFTSSNSTVEPIHWKETSPLLALYIQDQFETWWDLEINAGARMSYYGNTNTVYTEPRIAMSKQWPYGFRLELGYGRYFQTIRKVRKQNLFLNTPDFWSISNLAEIPILRNDQFLAGLSWQKNTWLIKGEAYYRMLEGVLADPLSFQTELNMSSDDLYTGSGRGWGLEFLIQKIQGKHTGWVSGTIGRVKNRLEGLEQEYVFSDYDQLFEGKLAYILRLPKWTFSTTLVYGSGRPYTPILGTYNVQLVNGESKKVVVPGDFNSGRLEPFHRLDFAVQYAFKIKEVGGSVGLFLHNVYNRKNVQRRDYYIVNQLSNTDNFSINTRDSRTLGFVPALKLSLTFR
jgi:ferric enterobactin receptor